ncbi:unnamed protein product [Ectocarpus sp. 12 AP-2014]
MDTDGGSDVGGGGGDGSVGHFGVSSFPDLPLDGEAPLAIPSAGGLSTTAATSNHPLLSPPAASAAAPPAAGAVGGDRGLHEDDDSPTAVSPGAVGPTTAPEGAVSPAASVPATPESVGGDARGDWGGSVGRSSPVPSRFSGSSVITADTKATEIFAQPLASEGAGSVFPLDLPMSSRRVHEVEFIRQFDRLAINPNIGEFWMLIDAHWVSRWVAFVLGQAGPPGPISNGRLFREDALSPTAAAAPRSAGFNAAFRRAAPTRGAPMPAEMSKFKEDLQAISDYRAIHPVVWYIFREIYTTDGTPDICRWKLDVYAEEVAAMRRTRILGPSQTKAIHQLRRFVARIKRTAIEEREAKERQASQERERIEEARRKKASYRRYQAWRSSKRVLVADEEHGASVADL